MLKTFVNLLMVIYFISENLLNLCIYPIRSYSSNNEIIKSKDTIEEERNSHLCGKINSGIDFFIVIYRYNIDYMEYYMN